MKKIIILILLALSSITYGQLSQINVGTSANDGTGEPLRSAFQKVNLGITQINTNTGNIALKLAITDTTNMLLRYINKADTATMLSPYITDIEARRAINDSLTARLNGATEISDVAVMLADSTGGSGHYASHYDMVTGLAGKVAIADTADMLTDYINKADTATMLSKYAKLTDIAEGGISLSAVQEAIADSAVLLSDIRPYYTFGAGTGAAADSTLFAKGNKSFGSFRIIQDSLYVESITNLYMTTGDSLRFNVYFGNGMTRTATDSLFTAPQGAGSYATQTLTPDNERTINHGQDVWVGIIGPQPANMRPKEWILQLNAKIVRD